MTTVTGGTRPHARRVRRAGRHETIAHPAGRAALAELLAESPAELATALDDARVATAVAELLDGVRPHTSTEEGPTAR